MGMNLIFLHGWDHTAKMWEGFVAKYHKHDAVALNLPGFGEEKLISADWSISDYADWVLLKLKSMGVTSAVLIGHSFGGKVAAEVAIKNPKLVKKLILVSAPILRRPSSWLKIKLKANKILKKWRLARYINVNKNLEYKKANANNLGRIFNNSVNYDATEKLPRLKTPTLIVWGENDKEAPYSIGKEMHKLIPNSKFSLLKNTGHNVYLENPNILFGLINKFINEDN